MLFKWKILTTCISDKILVCKLKFKSFFSTFRHKPAENTIRFAKEI